MNQKSLIAILIAVVITLVATTIYFATKKVNQPAVQIPVAQQQVQPEKSPTNCVPNYILNDEHKLIPDRQTNPKNLEIIQRFNVRKECLDGKEVKEIWIQEEQKYTTDSPFEKVMYCESEKKFLVVKSSGLTGGNFYLYEGKPCK